MPEHPCAGGLSPACFRAYPRWAKQALAYKLLLLLLPEPLSKKLPGVILRVGLTSPPGWPPEVPTPPWVLAVPIQPTPLQVSGGGPPIFVKPWEAGPVVIPGRIENPGLYSNDIMGEGGAGDTELDWGDDSARVGFSGVARTNYNCRINSIKLKLGKVGSPVDNVQIGIYNAGGDYKPSTLVTGGNATPIGGASYDTFSVGMNYYIFDFPEKPYLSSGADYFIVMTRSGGYDVSNFYGLVVGSDPFGACYYLDDLGVWLDMLPYFIDYQLWGYKV